MSQAFLDHWAEAALTSLRYFWMDRVLFLLAWVGLAWLVGGVGLWMAGMAQVGG